MNLPKQTYCTLMEQPVETQYLIPTSKLNIMMKVMKLPMQVLVLKMRTLMYRRFVSLSMIMKIMKVL